MEVGKHGKNVLTQNNDAWVRKEYGKGIVVPQEVVGDTLCDNDERHVPE